MSDQILDSEFQNDSANEIRPAGFWIRVGAYIIDTLAYSPIIALNIYNLFVLKNLPFQLLTTIMLILYKPWMEYKYGATLGKMAVKIKVVNKEYDNISLAQSIIRYIPWMISNVVSIYGTILLFNSPEFLTSSSWMEIAQLQKQVLPQNASYLSSSVLFISCFFIALNDKKRALHDMLAKTYCVYKQSVKP
jgi:uncharacterized RDD family membrane protein YckC